MSTETNDTTATVRYDGQEFSIDKTVAESDSLLRSALAGVYPSLATAAFSRTTEDGRLIVSATKTAGTKGSRDLDYLDLLNLPVGSLFAEEDGEGSDGALYIKIGRTENDIVVECLACLGEMGRYGIAEMTEEERRSEKYRTLSRDEIIAILNRLGELVAGPEVTDAARYGDRC